LAWRLERGSSRRKRRGFLTNGACEGAALLLRRRAGGGRSRCAALDLSTVGRASFRPRRGFRPTYKIQSSLDDELDSIAPHRGDRLGG
jgi:hypothetical protein